MSQVGALTLTMLTKTGQFMAGLKTADKGVKGLAANVGSAGRTIRRLMGAAFAVAGIGGFSLALRSAAKDIDDLAKTSDRLGDTTKNIAGMRHAASLAGVATSAMDRAMAQSNKTLGDAATGAGRARQYIDQMGLSIADLQKMNPTERFDAYAAGIRNLGSQSERAAASAALFADAQGELLPLLTQSQQALAATRGEAEALGLATSRVDAAKVEFMNDAMTKVKSVMSGLFRNIIIRMAPYIEAIADRFKDAALESQGFGDMLGQVGNFVLKTIGFMADGVQGIRIVLKAAQITLQDWLLSFARMADGAVRNVQSLYQRFLRLPQMLEPLKEAIGLILENPIHSLRLAMGQMVTWIFQATADMFNKMRGMFERFGGNAGLKMHDEIWMGLHNTGKEISGWLTEGTEETAAKWAGVGQSVAEVMANTGVEAMTGIEGVATGIDQLTMSLITQRQELRALREEEQYSVSLQQFAADLTYQAQRRAQAKADEIAEQQQHNETLREIEEYHSHDLIRLDREAAEIRARIEQERMDQMDRNWRAFQGGMSSMLGNLARLQESHSKRARKVGLVAAKAKIGQDTAAAAMASYQALAGIPIVGPALGAAAAAAAVAAGAVQLANAKSGAIGSGGPSAPDGATANHGGIHVPPGTSQASGPGGSQITAGSERRATLVLDRSVAIDPIKLADAVNQAGLDGYIFDGIKLR
jgi:hypothetical protein